MWVRNKARKLTLGKCFVMCLQVGRRVLGFGEVDSCLMCEPFNQMWVFMKNLQSLLLLSLVFAFSAQAYEAPNNFSSARVRYTIGTYQSEDMAKAAALQSVAQLKQGILPKGFIRLHQIGNRPECKSLNTSTQRDEIIRHVAQKPNSVKVLGFKLNAIYKGNGEEQHSATIRAQIPCVKKEKRDRRKSINQEDDRVDVPTDGGGDDGDDGDDDEPIADPDL